MHKFRHFIFCISLLLSACNEIAHSFESESFRLHLTNETLSLFDTAPHAIGARVVNASGQFIQPNIPLSYSATPSNIITIWPNGTVSCRNAGSASVLITGRGQAVTMIVNCRFIHTIESPSSIRLVIGRAQQTEGIRALDANGNEIRDITFDVQIDNSSIALYSAGSFVPISIGRTSAHIKAGTLENVIQINVIELVESSPIALADGNLKTYTLQTGMYELDIEVEALDHSRNGVIVSWVGTHCLDTSESQKHHLRCNVRDTASLTIRNPTILGMGSTLTGFMNLYRTAQ